MKLYTQRHKLKRRKSAFIGVLHFRFTVGFSIINISHIQNDCKTTLIFVGKVVFSIFFICKYFLYYQTPLEVSMVDSYKLHAIEEWIVQLLSTVTLLKEKQKKMYQLNIEDNKYGNCSGKCVLLRVNILIINCIYKTSYIITDEQGYVLGLPCPQSLYICSTTYLICNHAKLLILIDCQ